MSEPVTPKAQRRVIDGEVVDQVTEAEESAKTTSSSEAGTANTKRRAHNRAQKNNQTDTDVPTGKQANTGKASTAGVKKTPAKSSFTVKPWVKQSVLWGGFLAIVAGTLLYTRPNMDWQTEQINRLQTQVAQLHETNNQLADKFESQQTDLDTRISQILNQTEAQSPLTSEDLEVLKADTQQQLKSLYEQIQTDLTAFNRQVESKIEARPEQIAETDATETIDANALSEFQGQVESQLTQVSEELSKLTAFKAQQEQQEAERIAESNTVAVEPEQPQPQPLQVLSAGTVQQWIVEANSQWLLKGDAKLTRTQLLALEQAVALSDLPNISEVARTIGEDLSEIKIYAEQNQATQTQLKNSLKALTAQVKAVPLPDLKRSQPATEQTSTSEEASSTSSSLDTLLGKFNGLVSVKKRESEMESSSLEGLLLHDVLMQRLALLVDRVNWAANIESKTELQKALTQVTAFVDQHLSTQSQAFSKVIAPLKSVDFNERKPLAVSRLSAE